MFFAEMTVGKYQPLGAFLRGQRGEEVLLTFDDIEKITGVKLPPKAQHHRAWWSNNAANNVMTKVWLEAGYESARVDITARKLLFRRVAKSPNPEPSRPPAGTKKGERHPIFGALKDITRLVPGVDLTEPADPEWADWLDKKYGPQVR
jgi:hypothetical protein